MNTIRRNENSKKIYNNDLLTALRIYVTKKRSKELRDKYYSSSTPKVRVNKRNSSFTGSNEMSSDGTLEAILQAEDKKSTEDIFGTNISTLNYRLKNFNKYKLPEKAMKNIHNNLGDIYLINDFEKSIAQKSFEKPRLIKTRKNAK